MVRRLLAAVSAAAAGVLLTSSSGLAAGGFTLFGDATFVAGHDSPTGVQLRSVGTATFGGIAFAVPAGMTLSQLNNLATDYKFTDNSCGGGSPRFSVDVTTPTGRANVFVYIGPPPNYTGCAMNVWTSTGNLVTPASLVDATQLGGTFYDPYAAVQAQFGSYPVNGISLVDDGGWFFQSTDDTQTVVVDNVQINGTTYTFESKEGCKDGGWQNFTSAPGPFKSQGDCVSFFASGGNS